MRSYALLSLLDDPLAERREIYRLDDWLSESGLTGIITAKSEGDDPFGGEGYGFMQFMADCVVALELRVRSGRLALGPGNQIPRLHFRRERGAARHWDLGNRSGRYQRHDSRPRGFTGAGVQRRRTAGRDAWKRLLPRLKRADHRFRRHG